MNTKPWLLAPLCIGLHGLAVAQTDAALLQQQLQARDAQIRSLLQRVEALEQRLGGGSASAGAAASPGAPPATVQAAPAAAPQPSVPASASGGSIAEDETARALERALVREGGFVLPPKAIELEPRFQTTYRGTRGAGIVISPSGPQVAERSTDRYRHEATLGLRMGLPWSSQLEVRVPYVATRSSSVAAAANVSESDRGRGLGDVEVQLTRQLLAGRGAAPALLGSLVWIPATADYDLARPSPGSGFSSLTAGLTAVKRQDPLVFVGGVSYSAVRARTFAGSRIDPGDVFGLRLATLLAASPETSLRTGLDLSRSAQIRVNGQKVAGSDTLSGVVELGLSSLLSKNALIDFTLGFGITPDAPNLRVGLSLPIRFD